MSILPFCFYFVWRLCRRNKWLDVLGLTVAAAALVLTHLPLTVIGAIAIATYSLLLLERGRIIKTLGMLAIAGIGAGALTAVYWARMLPELSWINHSLPAYFSGDFDYRANFLLVPAHFLDIANDPRSLWFADLMLISLLVVVLPAGIFLIREKIGKDIKAMALVMGLAVFMTTPLSYLLWRNFGFLQRLQFPWRWLSVFSVFAAVLSSIGVVRAQTALKQKTHLVGVITLTGAVLLFVFTGVFVIRGAVYLNRAEVNSQMQNTGSADACQCWWPVWAKPSALEQTEKVLAGDRTVQIDTWTPTRKIFTISPGRSSTAELATFYYPRWKARVNGIEVPTMPTADGKLSIADLPPEAVRAEVTFEERFFLDLHDLPAALEMRPR